MLRLDINLVFTIVNLLILFLLLKKFLFGRVIGIMEKRKALIEEQLANAAETQKSANELKANYEETFKNAETSAAGIIADAKKTAKGEYDRIVSEANAQAGKIIDDAANAVELQRKQALRGMESEIANLAMTAATKVISDKSGDLNNSELYDEFLGKAGDANETDIN